MTYEFDREGLIEDAAESIYRGDRVLDRLDPGVVDPAAGAVARAHYAAASVRIQLAGYLGSEEEAASRQAAIEAFTREAETAVENLNLQRGLTAPNDEPTPQVVADLGRETVDRIERQRQDDYMFGRALEAHMSREDGFARDTGGTSQRRGVHGDPWRNR